MHSEPCFHSEDAAYSFCESRLWPAGPVCPHCRSTGGRVCKLKGKSTRRGTYKCYGCRRPFTVKIGTVFESSHLGLHLWLQAIYLISFSRKKVTVRQLRQTLGVGQKTAWVLSRRIRELNRRDGGPPATASEHRGAVPGEALANANTVATDHNRMKPTGVRTGSGSSPTLKRPEVLGSKGQPQQEYRKPRSKRRQHQPDPRQMTLL